jgi:hypothetical protein
MNYKEKYSRNYTALSMIWSPLLPELDHAKANTAAALIYSLRPNQLQKFEKKKLLKIIIY